MRANGAHERGQGTTEMVLLLPLLMMLAGGAICLVYICWQGIKTQEAANLAARIEGQERTNGGFGTSANDDRDINLNMGIGVGADQDPSALKNQSGLSPEAAKNLRPRGNPPSRSVYGRYRQAAREMFAPGEREHFFVLQPVRRSITDEVKVVRVMTPPKIFNLQISPIFIESKAYGGEDTLKYGLPRWAHTEAGSTGQLYWQQQLNENRGDDRSDKSN